MVNWETHEDRAARIANIRPELARAVLLAVCNDEATAKHAVNFLNKLEKRIQRDALSAKPRKETDTATSETGAEAGKSAKPAEPSVAGVKRKAPASQLQVCVQCLEPYTEADNSSTACQFHDGALLRTLNRLVLRGERAT